MRWPVSSNAESPPGVRDAVRRARAGHLAHAYLVIGSPEEEGLAFVQALLQGIYCTSGDDTACGTCRPCRLVAARKHADVVWIEPESRSRQILIDQIRPLTQFLARSSFEGGWKTGVVLAAERLNDNAANAFLKTLEEPSDRSLLLLVTESPETLLPTIISRCQRLKASPAPGTAPPAWHSEALSLLARYPLHDRFAQMLWNQQLLELLTRAYEFNETLEEAVEEETPADEKRRQARRAGAQRRTQRALLEVVQNWWHDVLLLVAGAGEQSLYYPAERESLQRQAGELTAEQALERVRAVDQWARRIERALPLTEVLDAGRLP